MIDQHLFDDLACVSQSDHFDCEYIRTRPVQHLAVEVANVRHPRRSSFSFLLPSLAIRLKWPKSQLMREFPAETRTNPS
jgi:hypothetical protein